MSCHLSRRECFSLLDLRRPGKYTYPRAEGREKDWLKILMLVEIFVQLLLNFNCNNSGKASFLGATTFTISFNSLCNQLFPDNTYPISLCLYFVCWWPVSIFSESFGYYTHTFDLQVHRLTQLSWFSLVYIQLECYEEFHD